MFKKYGKYIITAAILTIAGCSSDTTPVNNSKIVEPPKKIVIIPAGLAQSADSISLINIAGLLPEFTAEVVRAASNERLSNAANIGDTIDRVPLLSRGETIDGAKAYAIIAASTSSSFLNGIENTGLTLGSREALINQLVNNPAYVRSIPGYIQAKTNASLALAEHFNKIDKSSATVKQAAYDLQKSTWAKAAQDKQIHLNKMAANWEAPINQTGFDASSVKYSEPAIDYGTIKFGTDQYPDINDDVMAAAALHILRADSQVLSTMKLGSGKSCAYRAYLNSRMCMSATKYPFEHAFCISSHGQSEVKECMEDGVGYAKVFEKPAVSTTAKVIPINLGGAKKTTTAPTTKTPAKAPVKTTTKTTAKK